MPRGNVDAERHQTYKGGDGQQEPERRPAADDRGDPSSERPMTMAIHGSRTDVPTPPVDIVAKGKLNAPTIRASTVRCNRTSAGSRVATRELLAKVAASAPYRHDPPVERVRSAFPFPFRIPYSSFSAAFRGHPPIPSSIRRIPSSRSASLEV